MFLKQRAPRPNEQEQGRIRIPDNQKNKRAWQRQKLGKATPCTRYPSKINMAQDSHEFHMNCKASQKWTSSRAF